jgi:hypothetical protein
MLMWAVPLGGLPYQGVHTGSWVRRRPPQLRAHLSALPLFSLCWNLPACSIRKLLGRQAGFIQLSLMWQEPRQQSEVAPLD